MDINLLYLVASFFAMSFVFQLLVMLPCTGGYKKIFESAEDDDDKFENDLEQNNWQKRMLYFNWLRFVEYSISGSVVLVTIALISGIVDIELLTSIFFLSATCMLLGLIAEWCMRMHAVLEKGGCDMNAAVKNIFLRHLQKAFWVSHILAWVCIAIPWYIIFQHYDGWFHQCKGNPGDGPPEFVRYIVWIQMFLFTSFGVIQLVQKQYPHKRRGAEIAYIVLSLTAKAFLGIMLAANVLLQD